MKIFSNILKNKFRLFITAIVFISISFSPSFAATSGEIGQQIDQKKNELEALKKQLSSLEKEKATLTKEKSGIQGEIESVQNEIKLVTNNITTNEIKIQELDKEKEIKELEIDNRRIGLNGKMQDFYMLQYDSEKSSIMPGSDMEISWVGQKYSKLIIEKERAKISALGEEVLGITKAIEEQNFLKNEYSAQNVELDKKKKDLEAKLASLQGNLNKVSASSNTLRTQITTNQQLLEFLSAEQKKIQEEERRKMMEGGKTQIIPLEPGQYYFTGRTRDLYNGHYVGMSQWGAYGMAQAGQNFNQILTKFYTGVSVGGDNSGISISVVGYGVMNIEDYLSGLGEIPDKACGEANQVASRPDKYSTNDPNNSWDCWPEETIKAQVIAARTYALRSTSNGNPSKPICTTAACQVYKGGTAKRWASDETRGKVITHNGQLISALYSATACGHTEDNEKVFNNSDATGGTPYAYLRGVDYSQYDPKVSSCRYGGPTNLSDGWRTNGYTLDQISAIFAADSKTNVGTIKSMELTRGSSPNVWKVTLVGTSGTKTVAGWKFKSVWNDFVYNSNKDYIYGLNFRFEKVQ